MRVIYEGVLQRNQMRYYVGYLTMDHLTDILILQDLVFEQLENKTILQKLSEDEYRTILSGKGFIIGAFAEGELIAIRALLEPPLDEEHLGLAAGLSEEELPKVIYQEITFVHPAYRGNRLQQQLGAMIMNELADMEHPYQYVCCTVDPTNIPSLKDKFRQSMQVKALIQTYGGKLRYVFMLDLTAEKEPYWHETKKVRVDQVQLQQNLIASGWVGYELVNEFDGYWIKYGRI